VIRLSVGVAAPDRILSSGLVILDPKTHVSLWWLTAHVQPANLRASRNRNFDQAVAGLTAQAKQLTSALVNSNDTRK
jgi:hypothetical protein